MAAVSIWSMRPGLGREALIVPLVPFFVYFIVVFLGGAEEARKRHERSKRGE